ncbi:unnamed protein product [Parnassius mnemosyne]|uniref:Envelope protein n=1 Tax=Parnassius mnemosyne TaxID=213953 RepID=A0AAV1KZZ6_9NEOP
MEEVMRKQHKIINKQISALDSNINKVKTELEKLYNINQFLAMSVIANNLLLNLKSIQNMMTDAITDIYHGRFDVHLISPTQLRNELNTISGQIPKDLTLPISNIQSDFQKIYQFLQVKTKMTNKYLIFEIRLPLVSRDNYNLYRVIPIPHKRTNNFVNIKPIADYIAINLEKDIYIPMTSIDLQECIMYDFSAHLCHLKHPIYQRNSDEDLCLKNNYTNQCQINIAECSNMFIQLNKANNYLFTTCDKCNVRIFCGDQVTVERLRDAGVIAGCSIKSEELSIYTHKIFTSELKTGPEIYTPEIAAINQIIKLSIPETGELEKDADSFQANLTTLNENIKHLKSQNVIAENITFHDIHHYVAIYILVGVAVIAAICLACKRLRQRRNTAITSSISLDNITTEGLSSAPVAALAAPRAQRAAAMPAPRTQPVAASTERASSPAVPNAFNTQDRATSPILRTLILKRDEE